MTEFQFKKKIKDSLKIKLNDIKKVPKENLSQKIDSARDVMRISNKIFIFITNNFTFQLHMCQKHKVFSSRAGIPKGD